MHIKLKDFINRHESVRRSDDLKGQGFDFILREVNKGIKSWMRRGAAADNMWLNVWRNYDQLVEIRTTKLACYQVKLLKILSGSLI